MKAKHAGKKPAASRPRMPEVYGLPKDKKGLLPWSHVTEHMSDAVHYWIATVTPDGRPHSTPVDGVWLEDALYFGGHPDTRWRRNLLANPSVNVHLESTTDVLILRGRALPLKRPSRALVTAVSQASQKKYGYAPKPEHFEGGGVYSFRPGVVLAWKQFPQDATRWQFAEGAQS